MTITVTRVIYGALIKSVKRDDDAAEAVRQLRRLVEAFDRIRAERNLNSDKYLALAFDVSIPAVTGWRRMLDKTDPGRGPNVSVREAIKALGDPGRAWGLELALREMRRTVEDLETAADVRRALANALATSGAANGEAADTKGRSRKEERRRAGERRRKVRRQKPAQDTHGTG